QQKDPGPRLAAQGGAPPAASDALAFMASHAVSRPVVVDVTSDDTTDILRGALEHGFDVVLANKRPLAGSWPHYSGLVHRAETLGRRISYKATVGAGLPVIDTYRKLIESGDTGKGI